MKSIGEPLVIDRIEVLTMLPPANTDKPNKRFRLEDMVFFDWVEMPLEEAAKIKNVHARCKECKDIVDLVWNGEIVEALHSRPLICESARPARLASRSQNLKD